MFVIRRFLLMVVFAAIVLGFELQPLRRQSQAHHQLQHVAQEVTQIQEDKMPEAIPEFPNVSGRNIDGVPFALPDGLSGTYNLVIMVFTQNQQQFVYDWLAALRPLEQTTPLRVYELPTLPRFNWLQRRQLDFWMSAGISDPKSRATTITLYTDMNAMRNALNFTDTSTLRLLLIDREGKVYWEDTGAFSEAKLKGLEAVLAAL
ncbi:MAG: hypothetical protein AAF708_09575 [Deinococcota bacterium]